MKHLNLNLNLNLKMKLMTLILLAAPFAHADSVNWGIGNVQGAMEALGDLKIEKAQAVASCHYCNLTTCAGGPTISTALSTQLTQVSSSQYEIRIGQGAHKSGFMFKDLHSCSYRLHLQGENTATGNIVVGSILLATSIKDAANPIFLDEMLAEGLTEKMARPLRLQILKQGFADPEIVNLNQTPYFDGK